MPKLLSIFCLLFYFCSLSNAEPLESKADASVTQINFKNFENNIRLVKEGHRYRTVDGLLLELNHQLIVKTNKRLVLADLVAADERVIDGKEVFAARAFNYYLVTLAKNSSINQMIDILASISGVLLVQPDMLQIGYQSSGNIGQELTPKDLNKTSRLGEPVFAHKSGHHHTREPGSAHKPRLFSQLYQAYLTKLGISELWGNNQGQGVRIAVIDDGIQLQHPALSHVKTDFSYDLDSHSTSIRALGVDAEHGTKVAGVIFARRDGKEVDHLGGIAPKATLIGLRNPTTLTSNTLLSFHLSKLANADIVNCSWNSHWLLQPIADAVNELAEHGREGKGTAVIFAAGNDGKLLQARSIEASIKKAIVVAAANPRGKRLVRSNYGESVDLLVYGKRVTSTAKNDEYQMFAGTSLAAAITSGLAALALSAQPDLDLEQLQTRLKQLTQSFFTDGVSVAAPNLKK